MIDDQLHHVHDNARGHLLTEKNVARKARANGVADVEMPGARGVRARIIQGQGYADVSILANSIAATSSIPLTPMPGLT